MKTWFKLDSPECLPTRAHQWDAGADLKSTVDTSIPPGAMRVVDTGVSVKIPVGYVGLVFSRSSMGKAQVTLANSVGVIDESYRGNIKVMIQNNSPGFQSFFPSLLLEYTGSLEYWNDTARGQNGFGSSGK